MAKGAQQAESGIKVVSENRKARFNYHIIETYEAGIALTGAEIKSIRTSGININESYVRPHGTDVVLLNAHIPQYSHNSVREYDPVRPRKLLLKRSEINKLIGAVTRKGNTIVPLKVYLKRGYAKLEIALAKGKAAPDKRQDIKKREGQREIERYTKRK